MRGACIVETARDSPSPALRIVQLRTRESATDAVSPSSNEDFSVRQQGGRVRIASGSEATGLLKNKGSARARLHEHQPRIEKKQSQPNRAKKTETKQPAKRIGYDRVRHGLFCSLFPLASAQAAIGNSSVTLWLATAPRIARQKQRGKDPLPRAA